MREINKNSIFYKLGEWITKRRIKRCGDRGHIWLSYGAVKTCDRCGLTLEPKQDHYFDSIGDEHPIKTHEQSNIEVCAKYGHVTKADSYTCIQCGEVLL